MAGLDQEAIADLNHGVKDHTMDDQVVMVGPVEMGTTSAVLLAMTWGINSS